MGRKSPVGKPEVPLPCLGTQWVGAGPTSGKQRQAWRLFPGEAASRVSPALGVLSLRVAEGGDVTGGNVADGAKLAARRHRSHSNGPDF